MCSRFNQHNPNDKSREETRSSWSSSEEALAACEGLIYNIPLNGNRNCSSGDAHIDERIMEEVDYYVPTTGFYYFIFANENEITANFIRAHFDMHKTVFDVSSQVKIMKYLAQNSDQITVGSSAAGRVVVVVLCFFYLMKGQNPGAVIVTSLWP